MKVILLVDVSGKDRAGDILEVSDGYANDYLIPKGLAAKAEASDLVLFCENPLSVDGFGTQRT